LIPNLSSRNIWWQIFVPLCPFIADNVFSQRHEFWTPDLLICINFQRFVIIV
jgi:hypothetical protein